MCNVSAPKSFIEVSLMMRMHEHSNVSQIKYDQYFSTHTVRGVFNNYDIVMFITRKNCALMTWQGNGCFHYFFLLFVWIFVVSFLNFFLHLDFFCIFVFDYE